MISISCAYTTPAAKARVKTRTRRWWKPSYADMVRSQVGQTVELLTRQKRYGGERICLVKLLAVSPKPVPLADMPDEDYEREGFGYIASTGDPKLMMSLINGVMGQPQDKEERQSRRVIAGLCAAQPHVTMLSTFNIWRRSGGSPYVVDWEYRTPEMNPVTFKPSRSVRHKHKGEDRCVR